MYLVVFITPYFLLCSLLLSFQSLSFTFPSILVKHLFDSCHVISHLQLISVYFLLHSL